MIHSKKDYIKYDNRGDGEIKKFEIENNVILKKLSDVQAILIENGVESVVE